MSSRSSDNKNPDESPGGHAGCSPQKPWHKTLRGLSTAGLLAVIGYYLWTEHWAHVIAFLPFSLFLICPLMHLFGHGHGHGGHESNPPPADAQRPTDEKGARR